MESKIFIQDMISRSRAAQESYANATQEQVDTAVRAICRIVYDNAEMLAKMAVEETEMGSYEDKLLKKKAKSKIIWNNLKGKRSVGILSRNEQTGITEVAKPMGVVCGIVPCTNPIVTPMSNSAFALKCRNSIIICPHPRAKKCNYYLVGLFRKALAELGFPEDLIMTVKEPSIEISNMIMASVDIIVATGGMGMVKAAYSSGKPAYGVGAGNVQCIIDDNIDLLEAAEKIVIGRTFDNGIICLAEQSVIAPKKSYESMLKAMEEKGTYVIRDKEMVQRVRNVLFPDGLSMNKKVVGKPIGTVAAMAGIEIPENTKMISVEANGYGKDDVLCKEKMCPVVATFPYETFEEGLDIAMKNLLYEGKGHSISIHSNNKEHIEWVAERIPVSRIIVNQPAGTTGGGSWTNGFVPTNTLGCGTWGNNSITDNFNYTHLMNISRIGYLKENVVIPDDESIWNSGNGGK